jgi:hypothetical protein
MYGSDLLLDRFGANWFRVAVPRKKFSSSNFEEDNHYACQSILDDHNVGAVCLARYGPSRSGLPTRAYRRRGLRCGLPKTREFLPGMDWRRILSPCVARLYKSRLWSLMRCSLSVAALRVCFRPRRRAQSSKFSCRCSPKEPLTIFWYRLRLPILAISEEKRLGFRTSAAFSGALPCWR